MLKKYRNIVFLFIFFVLAGQLIFLLFSGRFTRPYYESRFFAAVGVLNDGADLHKLNEAAHYFGQTLIGWTKFPHFRDNLIKYAGLPPDTKINLHQQERQNIVFTLQSSESISLEQSTLAKNFLQSKIDEYNETTSAGFELTNTDYEMTENSKSYLLGACITFFLSITAGLGVLFLRPSFLHTPR